MTTSRSLPAVLILALSATLAPAATPERPRPTKEPALAVSVAGGDAQDQVSLQVLLNLMDYGMEPAEAVTAPPFETLHYTSSFGQKPPELGSLKVNPGVGGRVIEQLRDHGHKVSVQEKFVWFPTAVRIDVDGKAIKTIRGAGDPKAGRHAEGF